MKIADIEQQLIQAGCKSVHIERFWRNWYSGKPLNRSKVRLPAAAEAILPQMEEYLANQLTAQEKAESETGTRWVLKAYDGQLIECVLLPREGVCVSTQVGCAVGCVFCMTGKSGLIRQLTDLEVAGQVQYAMRNAPVKKVVLMGMGEPLIIFVPFFLRLNISFGIPASDIKKLLSLPSAIKDSSKP